MANWIFELGNDDVNEITSTSSSSSSSIGKNSDFRSPDYSDDQFKAEEDEVQSAYNAKQGFLDALEEALPIRKGISEFYGGRSKSFACLDEAVYVSSIKEIGKVENAYNRRNRNLIAYNHVWNKGKGFGVNGGGISKKPPAAAARKWNCVSRCESIKSNSSDCSDNVVQLRSRASSNNLVSLKQISVSPARRRSISCPDFLKCSSRTTTPSTPF